MGNLWNKKVDVYAQTLIDLKWLTNLAKFERNIDESDFTVTSRDMSAILLVGSAEVVHLICSFVDILKDMAKKDIKKDDDFDLVLNVYEKIYITMRKELLISEPHPKLKEMV